MTVTWLGSMDIPLIGEHYPDAIIINILVMSTSELLQT
jgi:hypothetical protein